jgi:hypothetical protein
MQVPCLVQDALPTPDRMEQDLPPRHLAHRLELLQLLLLPTQRHHKQLRVLLRARHNDHEREQARRTVQRERVGAEPVAGGEKVEVRG